jgi:hypothetical protein
MAGAAPEGAANRGLKAVVAMLAVLAIASVAVVAALLAQRGGEGEEEGGPAASREGKQPVKLAQSELARLAQERQAAFVSGDEEAFVKPFAKGEIQKQQRRWFANLGKVPLKTAGFQLLTTHGRMQNNFGGGVQVTVDVAFVHQIRGVDVTPVSERYRWTVKKKTPDAEPVITNVAGSPRGVGEGHVAWPAPWDLYEDMHVTRTEHVVVMSDAAQADEARKAAPRLEKAATDLLATWREHQPAGYSSPGFAVVIDPDEDRTSRMFGRPGTTAVSEDGFAAPIGEFGNQVNDVHFGGARVVVRDADVRVAQHEMAHALVIPLDRAPAFGSIGGPEKWVIEGWAEYSSAHLGDRGGAASLARAGFDGELPDSDTFYAQDPVRQAANYHLGYLALKYMADTYGENRMVDFVAAHYQNPKGLEQQFKDATGKSKDEFTVAWADYVRSQSR